MRIKFLVFFPGKISAFTHIFFPLSKNTPLICCHFLSMNVLSMGYILHIHNMSLKLQTLLRSNTIVWASFASILQTYCKYIVHKSILARYIWYFPLQLEHCRMRFVDNPRGVMVLQPCPKCCPNMLQSCCQICNKYMAIDCKILPKFGLDCWTR